MGSKFDALRPERLALGNKIQETAIGWNNSKEHPVAGFFGSRVYAVILKPAARMADVTLHIILGVGKLLVGLSITAPISFVARLVRGHGIETNWTAKQGVFHFGYASLYFVDIFVSPIVNIISPNIYPAKMVMDLKKGGTTAGGKLQNKHQQALSEQAALMEQERINALAQAQQAHASQLTDALNALRAQMQQERAAAVAQAGQARDQVHAANQQESARVHAAALQEAARVNEAALQQAARVHEAALQALRGQLLRNEEQYQELEGQYNDLEAQLNTERQNSQDALEQAQTEFSLTLTSEISTLQQRLEQEKTEAITRVENAAEQTREAAIELVENAAQQEKEAALQQLRHEHAAELEAQRTAWMGRLERLNAINLRAADNGQVQALTTEIQTMERAHEVALQALRGELQDRELAYARLEDLYRDIEGRIAGQDDELDSLREQLGAYQREENAETQAMLGALDRAEELFSEIAPPPPPPPPPPPSPQARIAGAAAPADTQGAADNAPTGGAAPITISADLLGQKKNRLKKYNRKHVWADNKLRSPNDPLFKIWATGMSVVIGRHAALVKILSDKLAQYKQMPKNFHTTADLRDDLQKIEKGTLEREVRRQADVLRLAGPAFSPTAAIEPDDEVGSEDGFSDDEGASDEDNDLLPFHGLMGASILMDPSIDYAKDTDELIATLEGLFAKKYQQVQNSVKYLRDNLMGISAKRVESKANVIASNQKEGQEARAEAQRLQAERAEQAANLKAAKDLAREIIWKKMNVAMKQEFVNRTSPGIQVAAFDQDPAFKSIEPSAFFAGCRPQKVAELLAALYEDARFLPYLPLKHQLGFAQ